MTGAPKEFRKSHIVSLDALSENNDLYEQALAGGDFLLLCSDGLSNIVTDQEMLYEALHGGAPEDCCQRLLDIAMSRGAPDNVTAVLFEIQ